MAPLIKLAVGVAGTALVADAAYRLVRSPLLSDLGSRSAHVMAANGITDGRVNWVTGNGWTWRVARLSGTADAATRVRTRDAVAALAGVNDAVWEDEIIAETGDASAIATIGIAECQARIDAVIADQPIAFELTNATPETTARQSLDAIAQTLQTCAGTRVGISVTTSASGSDAINMALSRARAEAVAAALVARGIAPATLSAIGRGNSTGASHVSVRITPGEAAR